MFIRMPLSRIFKSALFYKRLYLKGLFTAEKTSPYFVIVIVIQVSFTLYITITAKPF